MLLEGTADTDKPAETTASDWGTWVEPAQVRVGSRPAKEVNFPSWIWRDNCGLLASAGNASSEIKRALNFIFQIKI